MHLSEQVALEPIDSAEVTVLVDNAIDVLAANTDLGSRPPLAWEWSHGDQLIAEHGYSLWLTVETAGRRDSILYDAGLGKDTLLHNIDLLSLKPSELRTVVISHGHADHHGGLEGLFKRAGRARMPLVLHPDAWRDRKIVFPTGNEVHMPPPSEQDLLGQGWEIVEERSPTLLLNRTVLVTGQVERTTDFEKGFPLQQARTETGWEPDTWIWDDQGIVLNIRGKGLLVLSSCSHAGAVNVLRNAQRLTGVQKIHAFVGGLHLTGGLFESIMPRTLDEVETIAPDFVVPGHCTGWKATSLIATRFPDTYRQSNVGTTFRFAA